MCDNKNRDEIRKYKQNYLENSKGTINKKANILHFFDKFTMLSTSAEK